MSFCCFLSFNSPPEGIDWINILFLLVSKEQDGYFQFICVRLIFLSNKGPDDHNNGSQKQQEAGTRLTYNCAHLRSTKESLTVEFGKKESVKSSSIIKFQMF